MKAVVHVSEHGDTAATRALNGLLNLAGTSGVEHAVLVANGSAVNLLMEGSSVAGRLREALAEPEVSVRACANSLRSLDLSVDDLVPGVEVAHQGGVVELTRLQEQGYAYIKVP